eukprot:1201998-Prymnesium_polylepis.2
MECNLRGAAAARLGFCSRVCVQIFPRRGTAARHKGRFLQSRVRAHAAPRFSRTPCIFKTARA